MDLESQDPIFNVNLGQDRLGGFVSIQHQDKVVELRINDDLIFFYRRFRTQVKNQQVENCASDNTCYTWMDRRHRRTLLSGPTEFNYYRTLFRLDGASFRDHTEGENESVLPGNSS